MNFDNILIIFILFINLFYLYILFSRYIYFYSFYLYLYVTYLFICLFVFWCVLLCFSFSVYVLFILIICVYIIGETVENVYELNSNKETGHIFHANKNKNMLWRRRVEIVRRKLRLFWTTAPYRRMKGEEASFCLCNGMKVSVFLNKFYDVPYTMNVCDGPVYKILIFYNYNNFNNQPNCDIFDYIHGMADCDIMKYFPGCDIVCFVIVYIHSVLFISIFLHLLLFIIFKSVNVLFIFTNETFWRCRNDEEPLHWCNVII